MNSIANIKLVPNFISRVFRRHFNDVVTGKLRENWQCPNDV